MAHKIKLEVVSPEKTVFSDDVNMVIAHSTGGEIGILPNHAPLIASLTTDFFRILTDDGEKTLAVTGGFIEVQPKKITVIAVTAETPEEIDVDRAQKALADIPFFFYLTKEIPNSRYDEVEYPSANVVIIKIITKFSGTFLTAKTKI